MLDRSNFFALAATGLFLINPTARSLAAAPPAPAGAQIAALTSVDDDDDRKSKNHDEKNGDEEKEHRGDNQERGEKHENDEKEEKKEIEQPVPISMVPSAVMDAMMKEVPDGKVTESELVAKKHRIMYSFDVKSGDLAYEVKITVDGKFYSKKIDDDKDEDADKPEKK